MKFKLTNVEYNIQCLPEDMSVRGNVLACGDDMEDKKAEDQVIERLESTQWAWCIVKVTASWNGLHGSDYLGGCSYEDEEAFKQESGYFEDMKAQALKNLKERIQDMQNKVCDAEVSI